MSDQKRTAVLVLEWEQKSQWMESRHVLVGDQVSKLMALRGANALLAAAGLDVRLDELGYAHG